MTPRRPSACFIAALVLMLWGGGCARSDAPERVFFGGHVLTVDDARPVASAFAVQGGLFVAVGDDAEVLALAGAKTLRHDLQGGTVVPGFNDAHLHALMVPPAAVPLLEASTVGQVVERMRAGVAAQADRPWIVGFGYDDAVLGRHLDRNDLDRVSTVRPVVAMHASGHLWAVNSLALENASLAASVEVPEGGILFRDEKGEPTGLLSERATLKLLFNEQQPSPFVDDLRTALDMLEAFYELALSVGITSYTDAMVPVELAFVYWWSDPESHGVRVNLMLDGDHLAAVRWIERLHRIGAAIGWHPLDSEWLRARTVKLFHGMSLSGRTTRQYEPYHGRPDYYGLEPQRSQGELDRLVAEIDDLGFQAAVHSNGDYEIDRVLDAIEKATRDEPHEHRHRIEHGSIVNEAILQRMKDLQIVLAPHSYIYEKGRLVDTYGERLWPRMFANASTFEHGIPNAGNSDYPVSALSPLLRIQSLVTRTSREGKTFAPEQSLTIEQALQVYTLGGAYASFEEHKKGSITPGKVADFAILSDDPRAVAPHAIKDIRVEATWVAGRLRFDGGAGPVSSESFSPDTFRDRPGMEPTRYETDRLAFTDVGGWSKLGARPNTSRLARPSLMRDDPRQLNRRFVWSWISRPSSESSETSCASTLPR